MNYVPQAAAAKIRLQKTGAWLNTIGKDAYMLESSFSKRLSKFCRTALPGLDDDYEKNLLNSDGKSSCTLDVGTDGKVTGDGTALDSVGLIAGGMIFVNGYVWTYCIAFY